MQLTLWILSLIVVGLAFIPEGAAEQKKLPPGLYAVMETSQGNITLELFEKEAPKTVENFVGLAEGTKEWTDPKTKQKVKRPLYDGVIFHRVIPGFMIQGGDPLGNGTGGPGYQFEDEFSPNLKFDRPGRLAMANAGRNTNGSQFFITEGATDWLNNRHTIFGQVIEGQEVIKKIVSVPRDERDRPKTEVVIKKVQIIRSK
ncbi:MAG: peptidylprolyl isomerase [Candidatus Manganitrophaceae bacterium]|nr:MAG: peptidylprolyl isomerase [Candidatus Manganitrophaceae bacterium]